MALKPKALFIKAGRMHERGQWAEAEKLYKQILSIDPGHADALHMLGYLAYQNQRNDIAIDLISRAIGRDPRRVSYHNSLGGALLAAGKVEDAIQVYRRAFTMAPGSVEIANNLGNALQVQGRLAEAEQIYKAVAEAAPRNGDVLYNLGYNCLLQGDTDGAITWFRKAAEAKPTDALILNTLGSVFHRLRRMDEAVTAYERAVALAPDTAALHKNLAVAYHMAGRWPEAEASYAKALALDPADASTHNSLGFALEHLGRNAEAAREYNAALALKPDYAEARNNLGNLRKEEGDFTGALELYGKAIADDSFYTQSYLNRAELVTAAKGDLAVENLERMAALIDTGDERLPPGKALYIHFALAKARADMGDHDGAFAQLAKGNALRRAALTYDREAMTRYMRSVAEVFSADILKPLVTTTRAAPIFIVGMPRSGTTLIEQILASHPDVQAVGEQTAFDQAARAALAATSMPLDYAAHARDLAHAAPKVGLGYLDRLPKMATGKSRTVDKLPGNFLNVGLIYLAFPNARIIHAVRDPVDTCVSCYSKLFREWQEFTYDLTDLGAYARDYRELMAHWRKVLPADTILDVAYENVVADLDGEARRLLAFCGLTWDPAVLEFYRTQRPVSTASALQVRQPIYTTALKRAQPYTAHLGPLREALGSG